MSEQKFLLVPAEGHPDAEQGQTLSEIFQSLAECYAPKGLMIVHHHETKRRTDAWLRGPFSYAPRYSGGYTVKNRFNDVVLYNMNEPEARMLAEVLTEIESNAKSAA